MGKRNWHLHQNRREAVCKMTQNYRAWREFGWENLTHYFMTPRINHLSIQEINELNISFNEAAGEDGLS